MTLLHVLITIAVLILGWIAWIATARYRMQMVKSAEQGKIQERLKAGEVEMVADIDAIRMKPLAFRLFKDVHVIEPMDMSKFMEVMVAMEALHSLNGKSPTVEQLHDAYDRLFSVACPTVTREVITRMSHIQIGQVVNLLMEYLAGKAHVNAEKKSPRLEESKPSASVSP